MWENFPEKHWYMKADDDTYIIVPNLLTALHNYDHTKPYGISVDRSSSTKFNLIYFIYWSKNCGRVIIKWWCRLFNEPCCFENGIFFVISLY